MEEIKEMIKTIINGQHALKSELFSEISKFRKETRGAISTLRHEVKDGLDEVNNRLDKQGKQLAYLEEDAPTRNEYDALEARVDKLEKN